MCAGICCLINLVCLDFLQVKAQAGQHRPDVRVSQARISRWFTPVPRKAESQCRLSLSCMEGYVLILLLRARQCLRTPAIALKGHSAAFLHALRSQALFHRPAPRLRLETVGALVAPPSRVPDVASTDRENKKHDLGEEPEPAAALLCGRLLSPAAAWRRSAVGLCSVQIFGVDGNDVVVVTQFARLGTEAKVGYLGYGRWLVGLEAKRPLILRLVLQLQLQVLVLEVGQAELGGDVCLPDPPRRAAGKLAILAICVLVVLLLPVADHNHDERKDNPWPVVLVCIEEDAQSLEIVSAAEYRPLLGAIFGEPHGEAVAVQLVLAMNLELDLNLPICSGERYF